MDSFSVQGKKVTVFPAEGDNCPLIVLNSVMGDGSGIYKKTKHQAGTDFSLVNISRLEWDHDMAPWDIPPISKNDTPCTGGADDYLSLLTEKILPEAKKRIAKSVSFYGIAGYSLAGLFALYSVCQTDIFSAAATMSGSLWFPDFPEYIFSHEPAKTLDYVFFSLGDKESDTKNPYLKTVQENTQKIVDYYQQKGIASDFVLNSGGHYVGGEKRTADGIARILRRN